MQVGMGEWNTAYPWPSTAESSTRLAQDRLVVETSPHPLAVRHSHSAALPLAVASQPTFHEHRQGQIPSDTAQPEASSPQTRQLLPPYFRLLALHRSSHQGQNHPPGRGLRPHFGDLLPTKSTLAFENISSGSMQTWIGSSSPSSCPSFACTARIRLLRSSLALPKYHESS